VDNFEHVKHHGVDVNYRAVRDVVLAEKDVLNLGDIINGKLGSTFIDADPNSTIMQEEIFDPVLA
jgi:acyl-CoA reductase-like NAD-dependent aldehyde dehydrogenase